MSGRNLRDFVFHHRNQAQDEHEQNHLIARAMVGLDSNRYRRIDYKEAKLAANRYRKNADLGAQKLGQLKRRAKLGRDRNMMKQHYGIWRESYKDLMNISADAEHSFEEQIAGSVKSWNNSHDGELGDEIEKCVKDSELETEKFCSSIVQPIKELTSDVKIRLGEVKRIEGVVGAPQELLRDGNEVLKEIRSVQSQSLSVQKWLLNQQHILEQDLEKSDLKQELGAPSIPPLERALPINIVFHECPDEGLKHLILRQFVNLHTNYEKRIKEEQARIKSVLDRYSGDTESELWTFSTVHDLYHHFTPSHMQSNTHNLITDMLSRFWSQSTKHKILELETHFLKQRYSRKHCAALVSNYYRDVGNLTSSALAAFVEAQSVYADTEAAAHDREKQRKICAALHERVLQLRAKQDELAELEAAINEQARAREQEEEDKKQWLENERRLKMKLDISKFRAQKQRDKFRSQIEQEKRLERLKEEMEAQRKLDQERVEYRSRLLEEKAAKSALKEKEKLEEELERQRKLEELRQTVAITAEPSLERLVSDTIASRAHLGIGTNEEVEIQAPLFSLHGYSQKQIEVDKRLRVEEALRNVGIHNTEYARKILSTIEPPTQPRRDADSSALQYMFTR